MNTLTVVAGVLLLAAGAQVDAGPDPGTRADSGSAPVSPAPSSLPARTPVLLELFTSEGCSSCPPADVEFATLLRTQPVPGVEIVGLSLHVDYWNSLGWADPFSQKAFTARQEWYQPRLARRRMYTPQAIVDGRLDVVGHDGAGLRTALAGAASEVHGQVSVGVARTGAALKVSVRASGLPKEAPARLWIALVEDGLRSEVTRGENGGKALLHAAVTRALVEGKSGAGEIEHEVTLEVDAGWTGEKRVVAFAQDGATGRVLATGSAPVR